MISAQIPNLLNLDESAAAHAQLLLLPLYLVVSGGRRFACRPRRDRLLAIPYGPNRDRTGMGKHESDTIVPKSVDSAPPSHTCGKPVPETGTTIAKLTIPRLKAVYYVVEGTDGHDLNRGPAGHVKEQSCREMMVIV